MPDFYQTFVLSIDVKVLTSPSNGLKNLAFSQNGRKTEVNLVVAGPVHEHPGTACLLIINSGPQQAENCVEEASFDQVPLHLEENFHF